MFYKPIAIMVHDAALFTDAIYFKASQKLV